MAIPSRPIHSERSLNERAVSGRIGLRSSGATAVIALRILATLCAA
jgi:hypothetical protein